MFVLFRKMQRCRLGTTNMPYLYGKAPYNVMRQRLQYSLPGVFLLVASCRFLMGNLGPQYPLTV